MPRRSDDPGRGDRPSPAGSPPDPGRWDAVREKILGLGEHSIHKNHWPELQRRMQELAASEEKYRSLVHNLNVGIVRTAAGRDGRVVEVNPAAAALFGFEHPRDMVGIDPSAFFADAGDADELRHALRASGSVRNRELRLRRRDGGLLWISCSAVVVRDASGGAVWIDGIFEDVSTRRELEERLQQSQKMEAIGRLAGGVAHDFNNLLTAILGYGDLLLDALPKGHALRGCAEEIHSAAARGARLTAQLLAFARRQVLDPQPLDLNQVIAGMEDMLRRLCGETIRLEFRYQPGLWPVRVDAARFEQVVLNLVLNARDAQPGGGSIRVSTFNRCQGDAPRCAACHESDCGARVVLEFADEGSGIAPEALPHLFEPFYTTKPQGKGTGLGLAVVDGIVRQSGGSVAVESEPGRGSVFRVCVPAARGAVRAAPAAPDAAGDAAVAPRARGSETVLVAEDEEPVRRLLVTTLRAAGYAVHDGGSGAEALGRVGAVPPDLLVADVAMPGMTGPELAAALRRDHPALRVLFVSGFADAAAGDLTGPGTQLLAKPFSAAELLERVRALLDAAPHGSRAGGA